jgi:hypothetical protein
MTSHHAAATSWLLEFYDVVSSPPSSTTSLAFAGIGGTIEPENSRSNSMKLRIAKWACAGFLIAGFWALYFAVSSPASPIEPIASILTRITCPIALLRSYPLSIYSILFINAATYTLFGIIVETLRQHLHHTGNQNHPA